MSIAWKSIAWQKIVTQNVAICLEIRSHVACDANRDYRTGV